VLPRRSAVKHWHRGSSLEVPLPGLTVTVEAFKFGVTAAP
jgi:hypothetical protein